MALPEFMSNGMLPPGLHAAPLVEIVERYETGSEAREHCTRLLQEIVEAAQNYPTIKRILVWGSFITSKAEPGDLDYSIVVSVEHNQTRITEAHRRFFVPYEARQFYGADTGYLIIQDYPLPEYIRQMDFTCHSRTAACGIIEIDLCCEKRSEIP